MTDDEFAERQRKRIIDHWHASRRAPSDTSPRASDDPIDDGMLARLQQEANERAANNWDEDERQDFDGDVRPIGVAVADGLDATIDSGPNKTPFLGPAYLTEYLRSPHWVALRDRMLKRAGGFCQGCGERRPLEVHHLTYRNVGQERESELKVLCHECHELEHGRAF